MKKIIAMFLASAVLVFLGVTFQTTASAEYAFERNDVASKIAKIQYNTLKNIEKKYELVTIEYIESLSWEKIRSHYKEIFNNGDDLYIQKVITYINRDENFDSKKQDLVYVNGQVYLEDTDYDTMCKKIQAVVDSYNVANEIKIKLYTRAYDNEPGHMQVIILSSNYPATYVGQTVEIKWGAIFYEKSKNFGEGNWNTTFCIDYEGYGFGIPEFIPEDYTVIINGISYLDDNGNIISRYYKTFEEIKVQNIRIPIDTGKCYMLHVCTSKGDLGWLVPEAVKAIS